MTREKVVSCIQPSGQLHIGNYFGAIKNWVDLQDTHECIYGIADLHCMTMPYEPSELYDNTTQMIIDLLACGIDLEKSILFVQSFVPEHAELNWILNCFSSYPELSRLSNFQDKSEQIKLASKDNFISTGLFTYPVLQAADILMYNPDLVPVGKDQEQHLEICRNIVDRFNSKFGPYFTKPTALYSNNPKMMSLADPSKKMSKSLGDKHIIGIFEDRHSIIRKISAAVTDSLELTSSHESESKILEMSKGVANLFGILKTCGYESEWKSFIHEYRSGTIKYSVLKDCVIDSIFSVVTPLSEKRNIITKDLPYVYKMIDESSAKARSIAQYNLKEIKKLVGLRI